MPIKVVVIALASNLDTLGELSAILGEGFEITLIKGGDRQKLDKYFDGKVQYNIIHILAHGAESCIDASDGRISEAEIVTLLSSQTEVRFVVVAACDSYEIAGGIHNELHVPTIGYNAPIADKAAVEFSTAFYRAWRRTGGRRSADITAAVARGKESLMTLYPDEARKVRLINGDMITPSRFAAQIGAVDDQLASVVKKLEQTNAEQARILAEHNVKIAAQLDTAQQVTNTKLDAIVQRLDVIEALPHRTVTIGLVLLFLLVLAQIGTPFLQAAIGLFSK